VPDTQLVTRCAGHAGISVWYGLGEHGARRSFSGPENLDGPPQGPRPSIGSTVAWRGAPLGGGKVVPVAAIVGVTLNENPVDPKGAEVARPGSLQGGTRQIRLPDGDRFAG
jgi:hypothetical protein